MKAIAITAFFFKYRRRSVYRKRQKSQSSGRGSTFRSSDRKKKKIEPTPPPKPLTTSNLFNPWVRKIPWRRKGLATQSIILALEFPPIL